MRVQQCPQELLDVAVVVTKMNVGEEMMQEVTQGGILATTMLVLEEREGVQLRLMRRQVMQPAWLSLDDALRQEEVPGSQLAAYRIPIRSAPQSGRHRRNVVT